MSEINLKQIESIIQARLAECLEEYKTASVITRERLIEQCIDGQQDRLIAVRQALALEVIARSMKGE